jgi:hypothetical protein
MDVRYELCEGLTVLISSRGRGGGGGVLMWTDHDGLQSGVCVCGHKYKILKKHYCKIVLHTR